MKYKKSLKMLMITVFFAFFCIINNITYAENLSSDINGIDESKYPGFKSKIQSMQSKYPNSSFKVYYTGIDWTEAVNMEYQGHGKAPKNLFGYSNSYKGKWFCPICGKSTFDTGWYCASIDAIKYMMDPRNSLDETSIFQFKNLETVDVSNENIQTVINNKYSSFAYINNETAINAIIRASNECSMNGYSILAKIINEQGRGSSVLVTGEGYEGQYEGYYNFFNVGAYGNGTSTVLLNGLRYAFNHEWNSVESSILGGSEYYKSQYIGRGQNTLYYQRFNVVYKQSLFSHQYQQDIMGAQTSSTLLKNYYTMSNTLTGGRHEFIIPLYENMPASACSRPSTTQENDKLQYIKGTVTASSLAVRATPGSSRIITYLKKNETVKLIDNEPVQTSDGKSWYLMVSNIDGTYGYVCEEYIKEEPISLPSYVFNYKYYADNNSDIKAVYGYDESKLAKHFVQYGIKEGRISSPTFDLKYYLQENADVKKACGSDYTRVYEQFLNYGCNEYRRTSKDYDGMFYKQYYLDLANLNSIQLMNHYINSGKSEGRMASIDGTIQNIVFDAKLYADVNDDIRAIYGYDALSLRRHWLINGINEDRVTSLIFNPSMYRELNGDVASQCGNNNRALLEHFVKYGINEGRAASYVFDVKTYLNINSDVANAYGKNYIKAYLHFLNYGVLENRATSPRFNLDAYIKYNKDIQAVYGTNYKIYYIHYLLHGKDEGRRVM